MHATPEDHSMSHKISHKNPDVETIQKVHRDNLDSIYMFVLISTIYMVATNPKLLAAKCSFISFTISQFIVAIGYFTKVTKFRDMYPVIINYFTSVVWVIIHTILVIFQVQYFKKLAEATSWIVNVYMVACIIHTAVWRFAKKSLSLILRKEKRYSIGWRFVWFEFFWVNLAQDFYYIVIRYMQYTFVLLSKYHNRIFYSKYYMISRTF